MSASDTNGSASEAGKGDYIGDFTIQRAPDPATAVLVVIDMQYATGARDGALGRRLAAQGSHAGDYRFDRIERFVIPNTRRLLDAFRAAGRRVLYVTIGAGLADCSDAPAHMRKLFLELGNHEGSREHEIVEALKPQPGEAIVNKTSNGAFATSSIDSVLRAWRCEQLYLVGVSTNMCVDTTGREAADRGYGVTIVEDACGAGVEALHAAALTNFQRLFGRVRSTDEVLNELGLAGGRRAA